MELSEESLEKKMDGIITLYINPSIGEPSSLKKEVLRCKSEPVSDAAIERRSLEKAAFEDFLRRRYMTIDDFDNATNGLYMKSEKAIYQYMQAVYDYVYKDGAEPDWKDYIHPDYI
ncbi:hypothetical protein [Tritonibacter mobilis]|uniref:Uncharacterized protein n=1 Tax=Tritonibacter mobilis F1926 TaxID=1265309 RepID=A0A1B1A7L3_9RHOB|nr:hypothetical protein [Tritonibacter mobilis]ANP42559.1 hypothetical protein K529_017460 [Tritonibacter mobilis F1926]KJZ21963.1 hypothetical protein TW79_20605 [Tritonibacter mobilis]